MPVKYIPYYPNTVEGQAILDNVTRTQRVLRYRENDKVYDRIKRAMSHDVVIEDIIDFKTSKTKDGYETEINKFIGDKKPLRIKIRNISGDETIEIIA